MKTQNINAIYYYYYYFYYYPDSSVERAYLLVE